MRPVLIILIVLECLVLLGGAVAVGLFEADLRKPPEPPQIFRPPLYDAVTGDSVRYQRLDAADESKVLGYVDYEVIQARIIKNSGMGAEFVLNISERDEEGRERKRRVRIQPRLLEHGFLPPTIRSLSESDVPGGQTIVRSIRTTDVDGKAGFVVEGVRPRDGLDVVSDRYFLRRDIPVFGVQRWEHDGEVWVLHLPHREKRREVVVVE